MRVHTFGIGDDVDRELIEESAKSGEGVSYYVSESNKVELKSKVIDALQRASEPYLQGCTFTLNTGIETDYTID